MIFDNGAKNTQWGRMVSLTNAIGNTGHVYTENENRSLSYPVYKNQIKMDWRLKCKNQENLRFLDFIVPA